MPSLETIRFLKDLSGRGAVSSGLGLTLMSSDGLSCSVIHAKLITKMFAGHTQDLRKE